MTEDETKLAQNQTTIDRLNEENASIRTRIEADKEPKWLAAVSNKDNRLILHLAALDDGTKETLAYAIKHNDNWIAFDRNGYCGSHSDKESGLTNYPNTKIVFEKRE